MALSLAERAHDAEFRVTDTVLAVEVHGDVAVVTSFGVAHLRSPRAVREGPYRMTGVLLKSGEQWKWRAHHGSEPLAW
jgi:ketosteroid isomerase-like protein